jgi:hypothetical protein
MSGNDDLEREYKKGIATIARQLTLMETTLKEEIPKVVNEHVDKGKRRAANLRKAKAVTPKKPRRYSGTSLYNDDDYDDDDNDEDGDGHEDGDEEDDDMHGDEHDDDEHPPHGAGNGMGGMGGGGPRMGGPGGM